MAQEKIDTVFYDNSYVATSRTDYYIISIEEGMPIVGRYPISRSDLVTGKGDIDLVVIDTYRLELPKAYKYLIYYGGRTQYIIVIPDGTPIIQHEES